jgi:hypothetical protein
MGRRRLAAVEDGFGDIRRRCSTNDRGVPTSPWAPRPPTKLEFVIIWGARERLALPCSVANHPVTIQPSDFGADRQGFRPLAALSWSRPNIGSRMNREVHVRIRERPEVRVLRATRHNRSLTVGPT